MANYYGGIPPAQPEHCGNSAAHEKHSYWITQQDWFICTGNVVPAEVQRARCGAEQNTANLPANNPPHVCVDEDPDHWPDTKHHDYSGDEWDQPEPRHTVVIP
jgi:hypothetical protein